MSQRILMFESDATFAHEVRTGFEALGVNVDLVGDGNHGLDALAAAGPNLILLSVELPGMNGFLVCKRIKKQEGLENVPMIILSSEATDEVFEQHRKLRTHADDYLRKPIAFSDLLERVQRLVPIETAGSGVDEEEIAIADYDDDDVEVIAEAGIPESEFAEDEIAVAEGLSEARAFADAAIRKISQPPPPPRPASVQFAPQAIAVVRAPAPVAPPPAGREDNSGTFVTHASDGAAREMTRPADAEKRGALEAELLRSEQRAQEAEHELTVLRQRVAAAERAVADAGKKGGVSSREVLDLREQLNRKDREILGLRDQVSARDKQLLEVNDRGLTVERELAEAAEKAIDLQRELENSRQMLEVLAADKESAKKRFDDLRARFERTDSRNRHVSRELEEAKASHGEELKSFEQRALAAEEGLRERGHQLDQLRAEAAENAQQLAALRTEHSEELATLKQSAAEEVARAVQVERKALEERFEREKSAREAELRAELEAAEAAHIAQLKDELAAEKAQALAAQRLEFESAEAARAAQLRAELDAAHAATLDKQRTELAKMRSEALHTAQREHDAAVAALRADLASEAKRREQLVIEHEAALAALRTELETRASDARTALEEEHERALETLRAELARAVEQSLVEERAKHEAVVSQALAAHENELTSTRQNLERKHDTELAELRAQHERELEAVRAEAVAAVDKIRQLEASHAQAASELASAVAERDRKVALVDDLRSQVDAAVHRRAAEEALLERARRALAIGLSLLEDHKEGPSA